LGAVLGAIFVSVLAGVFDAGTGRAFGSAFAAGFTGLAVALGALAARALAGVFAAGAVAGVTGFLDF